MAASRNPSRPVSRYKHPPLDLGSDQIRLLRIVTFDHGYIHCELDIVRRLETPEYTAVSYVWGSTADTQDIYIDGQALPVTQNLYSFLESVLEGTPGVKYTSDMLFWIDQICIDQTNTAERNHQVAMMKDIFTDAKLVFAWLGPGDEHSGHTFEHIRKTISSMDSVCNLNRMSFTSPDDDLSQHIDDYCLSPRKFYKFMIQHTREFQYAQTFFARAYWSRLWIVQEFVLAKELLLLCGDEVIDWSTLLDYFRIIQLWNTAQRKNDQQIGFGLITKFLIARHGHKSKWAYPTGEYFYTLPKFSALDCADPRDRVYALLGLSDSAWHFPIDYGKTSQEVFWDAITYGLEHEAPDYHPWVFNGTLCSELENLGYLMGVSAEEFKAFRFLDRVRTSLLWPSVYGMEDNCMQDLVYGASCTAQSEQL